MFGIFGEGKGGQAQQPPRSKPMVARWPWEGEPDHAACDYAVLHLYRTLPAHLAAEGRVHAETCLAAIGAIAGFAAQRALFEQLERTKDAILIKELQILRTEAGAEYVFGVPLNRMLVPASAAENNQRLWSLAAIGAVSSGLAPAQLPRLDDMFAHVADTIGSEQEGLPSVARDHHPHVPGKELLRAVWPIAMMCFLGRFPNATREFGIAATQHWPAISGRVASGLLQQMPPSLDPHTGLTIVMESAIYASRLKPTALRSAVH